VNSPSKYQATGTAWLAELRHNVNATTAVALAASPTICSSRVANKRVVSENQVTTHFGLCSLGTSGDKALACEEGKPATFIGPNGEVVET
jgi:hypothetical protein